MLGAGGCVGARAEHARAMFFETRGPFVEGLGVLGYEVLDLAGEGFVHGWIGFLGHLALGSDSRDGGARAMALGEAAGV